jgi:ubiquinone/menaquinone biosynthesis C-methylase UbiE
MLGAYDPISDWYDLGVREGRLLSAHSLITSLMLEAIAVVEEPSVCDVACGQGHLARQLAKAGYRVIGVDISERLLAIARSEEAEDPLGIRYVQADAQNLPELPGEPFGGVVCNFALMDIADLTPTLRGIARIVRPGGALVAAITHPCFSLPPDRAYFDEGFWRSDYAGGVRGQVGAHHRTLSRYLTALGTVGLPVEWAAEPAVTERGTPPVLIFRSRRV